MLEAVFVSSDDAKDYSPKCFKTGLIVSQPEATKLTKSFYKDKRNTNVTILPKISWSLGKRHKRLMSVYDYRLTANNSVRLYIGVYYALENCISSFVFPKTMNRTEKCIYNFGVALNEYDINSTDFKHCGIA